MNIFDNVDWHVHRGIGAEVSRGDDVWVEIGVGGEVVSSDGNRIESEVVYKVGSVYDSSVDKCIKGFKCGVGALVSVSVG